MEHLIDHLIISEGEEKGSGPVAIDLSISYGNVVVVLQEVGGHLVRRCGRPHTSHIGD
jgi:hypothetical protein